MENNEGFDKNGEWKMREWGKEEKVKVLMVKGEEEAYEKGREVKERRGKMKLKKKEKREGEERGKMKMKGNDALFDFFHQKNFWAWKRTLDVLMKRRVREKGTKEKERKKET